MGFELKKKLRSAGALATAAAIALSVGAGVGLRAFIDNGYGITAEAYKVVEQGSGIEVGNVDDTTGSVLTITPYINGSDPQQIISKEQYYLGNSNNTEITYSNINKIIISPNNEGINFTDALATVFHKFTSLKTIEITQNAIIPYNDDHVGYIAISNNADSYGGLYNHLAKYIDGVYDENASKAAVDDYLKDKKIYVPKGQKSGYLQLWAEIDIANGDEPVTQKKKGLYNYYISKLKGCLYESAPSTSAKEYTEINYYPFTFYNYGDHLTVGVCDEKAVTADIPSCLNAISLKDDKDKNALINQFDSEDDFKTAAELPITKIEENAFNGCTKLTDLTISENIDTIGKSAFWGCSALKAVQIPETVAKVEADAFKKCASLEAIIFYGNSDYEEEGEGYDTEIYNSMATISNGTKNDRAYFDGTIYGWRDSQSESYANYTDYKFVALDDLSSEELEELIGGKKDPVVTEPIVTEPVVTEPVVTEPPVTETEVTSVTTTAEPWKVDIINGNSSNATWDADIKVDEYGVVTWNNKSDADSYRVFKKVRGAGKFSSGSIVKGKTEYKLASVPTAEYTLYIRAYKKGEENTYLDSKQVIIPSKVLGTPTNLVLNGRNLAWDPAPNAKLYAVIMRLGPKEVFLGYTPNTNMTVEKNIFPKTQFQIIIRAYEADELRDDQYNSPLFFHEDSDACVGNPKNVGFAEAPTVSEDGTVTWKAVSGAKGYYVVKEYNGHQDVSKYIDHTSLSYKLAAIPNVAYKVFIRSAASSSSSAAKTDGFATECTEGKLGYCAAPKVDNQGNVSFKTIPLAEKYKIIMETKDGTVESDELTPDPIAEGEEWQSENIQYTFEDMPEGDIKVYVRSYSGKNYTDGESYLLGDLLDKPEMPTINKNKVTWDPVKGAVKYEVWKKDNKGTYRGSEITAVNNKGKANKLRYTLNSAPKYCFRVWLRAYDENGNYKESDQVIVNENEIESLPAPVVDVSTATVYWDNIKKYMNEKGCDFKSSAIKIWKKYVTDKKQVKANANVSLKKMSSYTLNRLPADRQVEITAEVYVINNKTEQKYKITSDPVIFTRDGEVGIAVPRIQKIDGKKVTFEWDPVHNADKYEIVYSCYKKDKNGNIQTYTDGTKKVVYGKKSVSASNFEKGKFPTITLKEQYYPYTIWVRSISDKELDKTQTDGQRIVYPDNGSNIAASGMKIVKFDNEKKTISFEPSEMNAGKGYKVYYTKSIKTDNNGVAKHKYSCVKVNLKKPGKNVIINETANVITVQLDRALNPGERVYIQDLSTKERTKTITVADTAMEDEEEKEPEPVVTTAPQTTETTQTTLKVVPPVVTSQVLNVVVPIA